MGVDAIIIATGDLTEAPMWQQIVTDIRTDDRGTTYATFCSYADRCTDFIIDRMYSAGYPRGHWPSLYTAIRYMQTMYPNAVIRYGDDHARDIDEYQICDEDYLQALWNHYLSADGDYDKVR